MMKGVTDSDANPAHLVDRSRCGTRTRPSPSASRPLRAGRRRSGAGHEHKGRRRHGLITQNVLGEPRDDSAMRSLSMMTVATDSASSCSQNRRTVQPDSSSRVLVSLSRSRLRESLAAQNSALVRGTAPCNSQQCQKQPSMNIAIRALVNTMSAVRRKLGTGRKFTRNRYPFACKSLRTASSGIVSRDLLPCMIRRRSGLTSCIYRL